MKLFNETRVAFGSFFKRTKADFKIDEFKKIIEEIKTASKKERLDKIKKLIDYDALHVHDSNKELKILAECSDLEYEKELHTSQKLLKEGYHIVFVPKGYFSRSEKRFDIFLIKGHLFFEVDLKCISSGNTDTIGKRITKGSNQAKRLVLDFQSNVPKKKLVEGLRTGCSKNENLVELLLFYNGNFYTLQVNQIMNNKIFDILK